MGLGFTYSIYFMLSVVFVVLPLTAGGLLWSAYRRERERAAAGRPYSRPGAIRWTPPSRAAGESGSAGEL